MAHVGILHLFEIAEVEDYALHVGQRSDGFLKKSLRGVAIKIFVGNEARAYPIAKVGIVSNEIALTTQKIERLIDSYTIEPGLKL